LAGRTKRGLLCVLLGERGSREGGDGFANCGVAGAAYASSKNYGVMLEKRGGAVQGPKKKRCRDRASMQKKKKEAGSGKGTVTGGYGFGKLKNSAGGGEE